MASLIERLVLAGQEQLERRGADWLEKGLNKLEAEVAEELAGEPELLEATLRGLDALRVGAPHLSKLGAEATAAIVAQLGAGRTNEARLLWIQQASYADALEALYQAGDRAAAAARSRELAWRGFLSVVEEVGRVALQSVLPWLLTMAAESLA